MRIRFPRNLAGVVPALVVAACLPLLAEGGAPAGENCRACHEEVVAAFQKTPHAASPAACEACHGPGEAHIDGGGDTSRIRIFRNLAPAESAAVCQTCHARGKVAHWTGSAHDHRKVACVSCHNPHPQGEVKAGLLAAPQLELCGRCHPQQKAKMFRSGHMPVREEKMTCASCHNPHGTLTEKGLHQNSINENCYACHAEKRGPFLWDHEAVREDCVNCHDPHGSIHNSMLKVKMPVLCQSCHVFSRHPSTTHPPTSRIAWNKSCLNCHSMIHGSNHPAGNFFTR